MISMGNLPFPEQKQSSELEGEQQGREEEGEGKTAAGM